MIVVDKRCTHDQTSHMVSVKTCHGMMPSKLVTVLIDAEVNSLCVSTADGKVAKNKKEGCSMCLADLAGAESRWYFTIDFAVTNKML